MNYYISLFQIKPHFVNRLFHTPDNHILAPATFSLFLELFLII